MRTVSPLHRFRMSIAANLVRLRKAQAITQTQFADLAGLHVNQVRRYETGAAQPSLEGLKKEDCAGAARHSR